MKAVLFDLDGVLVATRDLHRDAFITALASVGVTMTPEEHTADFNGLPTTVKVQRLIDAKRLCACKRDVVIQTKQMITEQLLPRIEADPEKQQLIDDLATAGYRIAVVSNAIRTTVVGFLVRLGLVDLVEVVLSNQDVPNPKPAPDGWLIAMQRLGVTPEETLIIEDSPPGIASAYASGAQVMEVSGPEEVTGERVFDRLRRGSEQRRRHAEARQAVWGDGSRLRARAGHVGAAAAD